MSIGSRLRNLFVPALVRDTLRGGAESLRAAMRLPRPSDPEDERRLRAEFGLLLERWGLTEAALPRFRRRVLFDFGIWSSLILIGLVLAIAAALHGYVTALLFAFVWLLVGGARMAADAWVLTVVRDRRYQPFFEWAGLARHR